MNAMDVVRFGHLTLLGTLEPSAMDVIDRPGACGNWSVKDIVAHLGSYELVLIGILDEVSGDGSSTILDQYRDLGPEFNDAEVIKRRDQDFDGVLNELNRAHGTVLERLSTFTPERLGFGGTIPWYGDEYSLDDLLVYMYYGHKREHAAQIAVFREAGSAKR
ncbi:MAG: maleylpyruvate isomerase N-terminal domain-containing protein [Chloroflexia bacterium]|nr:maleylpyruvate isomerase N-terminal domain-containing protein [Chloroflexia bacterium]